MVIKVDVSRGDVEEAFPGDWLSRWTPLCATLKSASLTVNDASKVDLLGVRGEAGPLWTAFFVPNCTLQKPKGGEWREVDGNVHNFFDMHVCLK